MTTALHVIDGDRGETPNESVARRIRQELAGKKRPPSQSALAARMGIKQQALSRRLLGSAPFDFNEIHALCAVAEIDVFYVLTGRREAPRPEGDPDGGLENVRPKGFEPLTFWSVRAESGSGANVVPLHRRPQPRTVAAA